MTELNLFKARQLSAAQYVLALHQPQDRVAVLTEAEANAVEDSVQPTNGGSN